MTYSGSPPEPPAPPELLPIVDFDCLELEFFDVQHIANPHHSFPERVYTASGAILRNLSDTETFAYSLEYYPADSSLTFHQVWPEITNAQTLSGEIGPGESIPLPPLFYKFDVVRNEAVPPSGASPDTRGDTIENWRDARPLFSFATTCEPLHPPPPVDPDLPPFVITGGLSVLDVPHSKPHLWRTEFGLTNLPSSRFIVQAVFEESLPDGVTWNSSQVWIRAADSNSFHENKGWFQFPNIPWHLEEMAEGRFRVGHFPFVGLDENGSEVTNNQQGEFIIVVSAEVTLPSGAVETLYSNERRIYVHRRPLSGDSLPARVGAGQQTGDVTFDHPTGNFSSGNVVTENLIYTDPVNPAHVDIWMSAPDLNNLETLDFYLVGPLTADQISAARDQARRAAGVASDIPMQPYWEALGVSQNLAGDSTKWSRSLSRHEIHTPDNHTETFGGNVWTLLHLPLPESLDIGTYAIILNIRDSLGQRDWHWHTVRNTFTIHHPEALPVTEHQPIQPVVAGFGTGTAANPVNIYYAGQNLQVSVAGRDAHPTLGRVASIQATELIRGPAAAIEDEGFNAILGGLVDAGNFAYTSPQDLPVPTGLLLEWIGTQVLRLGVQVSTEEPGMWPASSFSPTEIYEFHVEWDPEIVDVENRMVIVDNAGHAQELRDAQLPHSGSLQGGKFGIWFDFDLPEESVLTAVTSYVQFNDNDIESDIHVLAQLLEARIQAASEVLTGPQVLNDAWMWVRSHFDPVIQYRPVDTAIWFTSVADWPFMGDEASATHNRILWANVVENAGSKFFPQP